MTDNSPQTITPPPQDWIRQIHTGRDNLEVLRTMPTDWVDLIYLDPPFKTDKRWMAPLDSKARGVMFNDTWTLTDIHDTWHGEIAALNPALYRLADTAAGTHSDGMAAYLIFMGVRMLEMQRVLKPTGSIYLHCDPTASHYLKAMMDCIWGQANFRNEIVWRIGWVSGFKTQKKGWIRNHDSILYYLKSNQAAKLFNKEYIPYPDGLC